MNKNLTLLIMAAGMGSRFGGLKQIEPIGPNGEFIIDYSIYDAIKAGFTKVVFIIKEENYELFKDTIGKRVEKQNIQVEYVFQKTEDVPTEFKHLTNREKPWGTGHAILSAKDKVNENFAIINADDFYGRDGYMVIANYLRTIEKKEKEPFSMVAYQVNNTLTENGAVKRGVCEQKNGYLTKIIESNVEKIKGVINVNPLDGSESFTVEDDTLVSMNLLGFTPKIFEILEEKFYKFLEKNQDNYQKCEFLIPEVLFETIEENVAEVKVLPTNAKWYGVTYREDKESVVKAIEKMIEKGEYPNNLWK